VIPIPKNCACCEKLQRRRSERSVMTERMGGGRSAWTVRTKKRTERMGGGTSKKRSVTVCEAFCAQGVFGRERVCGWWLSSPS
jgi:hypothetical protein